MNSLARIYYDYLRLLCSITIYLLFQKLRETEKNTTNVKLAKIKTLKFR